MTTRMTTTGDSTQGSTAGRLLRSSARHSYDPEIEIDWDAPLVDAMWFASPERLSLYGTPMWDALSADQRLELSKHEICSIASVGMWFELILMQMMLRDVYDQDPRTHRVQYSLTEIGDETRHSVMFAKMVQRCGAPAYGAQRRVHQLGRAFKALGGGVSGYASILVAEEILDRMQRELTKDERVQPLVRMVSRIHVLEEARHMTFAREQVELGVPRLSRSALLAHQLVTAQTCFMLARSLVHPAVYGAVGLDPQQARRQALSNPRYQQTMAWTGEKVVSFLDEQGLVPRSQHRIWRRSLLMPA